jgi:hypothetical protein
MRLNSRFIPLNALAFGLLMMGTATGQYVIPVPLNRQAAQTNQPIREVKTLRGARILRVNSTYQYAILDCTVLPTAGEKATVMHGSETGAVLRITGRQRGQLVVADIEQGEARAGDWVMLEQLVTLKKEQTE